MYLLIYAVVCIYFSLCFSPPTRKFPNAALNPKALNLGWPSIRHLKPNIEAYPDPREDPKSRSLYGGSYKVPLVV